MWRVVFLTDGLRAITKALEADPKEESVETLELNPIEAWQDVLLQEMGVRLKSLDAALAQLADSKFDVHVVNEAPPGVEELLKQQVSVMERTLIPFVKVATQRLDDSEELRQKLDEFIELVKGLDDRLLQSAALDPG